MTTDQKITREQLEEWWDKATDLNDATTSPLAGSIITEALECSDGDPVVAIGGLQRLIEDISGLMSAIEDGRA